LRDRARQLREEKKEEFLEKRKKAQAILNSREPKIQTQLKSFAQL